MHKKSNNKFDSRTCYNKTRSHSGFYADTDRNTDKNRYLLHNILKIGSEMKKSPYKLAKYYNGSKEHFVYFSWYDLENNVYVREKVFLKSRYPSKDDTEIALKMLAEQINESLRIENSKGIYSSRNNIEQYSLQLKYWLELACSDVREGIERKKLFRSLLTKIEKIKWQDRCIDQLNNSVVKDFIYIMYEEELAGKTINNYLWAFEKISQYAIAHGAILDEIKTEHLRVRHPKNETGRFPPLSHKEKDLVFNYYREKNPAYYLFLMTLYYSCIRPGELHRLKISNIDFDNKTIFVPWFDAKNGLSNHVQIFSPLIEAFHFYGIDKMDGNYHLFSRNCKPGKELYKGNYCSDTWLRNRHDIGLDESKQMYGLKHTFNMDYVNSNHHNIDWEFLRRHNRHATVMQTQQYISRVTAYFLDESKANIYNYFNLKKVEV